MASHASFLKIDTNHVSILREIPNDRVFFEELELLLLRIRHVLDQLANRLPSDNTDWREPFRRPASISGCGCLSRQTQQIRAARESPGCPDEATQSDGPKRAFWARSSSTLSSSQSMPRSTATDLLRGEMLGRCVLNFPCGCAAWVQMSFHRWSLRSAPDASPSAPTACGRGTREGRCSTTCRPPRVRRD